MDKGSCGRKKIGNSWPRVSLCTDLQKQMFVHAEFGEHWSGNLPVVLWNASPGNLLSFCLNAGMAGQLYQVKICGFCQLK